MKFRVRLGKQRFVVHVEDGNSTVGNLKEAICHQVNISDISSLKLSLNGADIIDENERTLSSLGLVNGDLVYALSLNQDDPSLAFESGDVSSTADPSNVAADAHQVVNNSCNPVFCRDGVSATLEILYNTANVTTQDQAAFVLVHALMLESGFCLKVDNEESSESLPVGWNNAKIIQLCYIHNLSSSITCQLVLTSLGPFIYAYVWSLDMQSSCYKVKLVVSQYIRGDMPLTSGAKSVYKNLHKVSRLVKNDLVHPILANIQSYLGLTSPYSLSGLPPEIQLIIFSQLSAASVVSLAGTCKGLNTVCNDGKLWQFFCLRDFGQEKTTLDSWKEQYKILHIRKRVMQRHRNRAGPILPFNPDIPFGIPDFNPFLPRIPRIIGGAHDLYPVVLPAQPRVESSLQILHPDTRSRSDLRLRDAARRETFFS